MNINGVNLNLLASLDALLAESSVTRAARRVGVTQPAMSNNLAQLRALFGDPLFRRQRHGLEPTPRALEIGAAIRRGLSAFEAALTPPSFDPARDERRFVIATSDYVEFVLLPPLLERLARGAPGLSVEVRPWGLHEVPQALAKNEVQLMIGYYDELPPQHRHEALLEEEYVCVVREQHPRVGRRLTLERYLELEHVLVSQKSDSPGSVDRALARLGKRRKVAARVSHFLMVPMLVARTDLVAALSRRVAEPFAQPLGLRLLEPPLKLPRARVRQVWHEQLETDPAHRFLRQALAAVAQGQ
jgi:DNA-binding transcriptional LysR family regulator